MVGGRYRWLGHKRKGEWSNHREMRSGGDVETWQLAGTQVMKDRWYKHGEGRKVDGEK